MPSPAAASTLLHDVFISYSRQDAPFARTLSRALERYRPPRGLGLPNRPLRVFRDESDFLGVEYHQAVRQHLADSAKLLVLCSPHARQSAYVDDEIRQFTAARGAAHIVPVLLSGIPNNEAAPGQEAEMAFPAALCEALEVPLAASFRGFDPRRDRPHRGVYYGAWYSMLANLYGLRRSEIEQRDKRRRTRTQATASAIVVGLVAALSVALVVTLASRQEAVSQRRIAEAQTKIADEQRTKAQAQQREADAARLREQEQRRLAEAQRHEAEHQAILSRSRELAADAQIQLATGPELGLSRAVEAATVFATPEAESALRLALLNSRLRTVMRGHTGPVLDATFNPDGRFLVSAGQDGTVRIWETATGREVRRLSIGGDHVAFSPDGRLIAVVSVGQPSLWDAAAGRKVRDLPGEGGWSKTLAFSPDSQLIAVETDELLQVWETASGRRRCRWETRSFAPLSPATFSPDSRTLVTALEERVAKILDMADCQATVELAGNNSHWIGAVGFSPDGKLVVTAGSDQTVQLWNAATGRPLEALAGHADSVLIATFSRDGRRLLTASEDGTARVWNFRKPGYERRQVPLRGHPRRIIDAELSPDTQLAVTVSLDHTAQVWDAGTGDPLGELTGHTEAIIRAQFSADSRSLMTAAWDGTVRIWTMLQGFSRAEIPGASPTAHLTGWAFSPDGQWIVTSSDDLTAHLWEARTGRDAAPRLAPGSVAPLSAMAFSPDGKRLLTADLSGARVRELAPHGRVIDLAGAGAAVRSATFSGDGKRLLTTSSEAAKVWNAVTGRRLAELREWHAGVSAAAPVLSPDGRLAAAADLEGVTVWDLATGRLQTRLPLPQSTYLSSLAFSPDSRSVVATAQDYAPRVERHWLWKLGTGRGPENLKCVAFSPDGRQMASVDADGRARVRDSATGREVSHLAGRRPVSTVVFSPDGRWVLSAGGQEAFVWEAANGKVVAQLRDPRGFHDARFSPDGRFIASASNDQAARIWETATARSLFTLRGHEEPVNRVAWSPAGRQVLTQSGKILRIFDCEVCAPREDLLALARRRSSELKVATRP